ncbi:hypothetical protein EK21DRAFT_116310 [Setomelanomma holmii]|uniref:Uncharacterized protein n=1 Tax=Setomelanomma holmii TaxID=210430 RepID=A0A9P4H1L4_9PLEO|nr:hypothetical protein EK21DRAFT_116310 [Setomelanomma holmii]
MPEARIPRLPSLHRPQYASSSPRPLSRQAPACAQQPTLVEQLTVKTDAPLRDNNFFSNDVSDAVIKNASFDNWSVGTDGKAALENRRDCHSEEPFTITPPTSEKQEKQR